MPGLSTLAANASGYQLFSKDMLMGSILDGRTFQASETKGEQRLWACALLLWYAYPRCAR
jgi:hypothetical protein